ncbi:CKLF-like MARVEL transmembrane domain-containing protein 3 [Bagarius yarrelli]|uniref:CKLF-like MARVEL transmembrane domain-containing protein 3 n=1 Tax=Bagarius yarrelli TaxID=175774 RepID=A0A556VVF1_BAGYA|nr:CKLF-like MARVEL transmembrane domain-containing protein 3 [Bagarius yarrelli]
MDRVSQKMDRVKMDRVSQSRKDGQSLSGVKMDRDSQTEVFGFIATIVFALDFYFIFNELADFLKGGANEEVPNKRDSDYDSDSD